MRDKIRYLVFVNNRWRWRPTRAMRAKGFRIQTLGPELTLAVKTRAIALNDEWDCVRRGAAAQASGEKAYPIGSVGEGYQRALKLRAAERASKNQIQSREQEKRDDWIRAWKWIGPVFGDVDPRTVQPEHFIAIDSKTGNATGLVPKIERSVSATERHRTIKVWRALWKKMATMGYCALDADPSKIFANTAPAPRQALWTHHEAMKLVQGAWRADKRGLAAVIAVVWDTMLSPIDVRRLTRAQMRKRSLFSLERAKTGRAAAGTLTAYSVAVLDTYIATLGFELMDNARLFRTAGSAPGPKGGRRWAPQEYTKDRLEKDFAEIREVVFGPGETRQLADMRRSGHVEGRAGGASPSDAASKMANTISVSNRLEKTYNPVNVVSVKRFDDARVVGRKRLREEQTPDKGPAKSVTSSARKVSHRAADKS